MVSELMVVFGKGGEVFVVPTQWEQRKPKRPTHKDPEREREREREREDQRNIVKGAK